MQKIREFELTRKASTEGGRNKTGKKVGKTNTREKNKRGNSGTGSGWTKGKACRDVESRQWGKRKESGCGILSTRKG